jgi:hypothetical protein
VSLDHVEAVLALLRGNPNLTVFPAEDGEPGSAQGMVPPDTQPPYVAVHFDGGPALGETIDMSSSRRVIYAYCHSAGETLTAALAVADQVEASLLDVKPVVAGRQPFPIRWDSGNAGRPDESVTPAVWSKLDVYRLETIPG